MQTSIKALLLVLAVHIVVGYTNGSKYVYDISATQATHNLVCPGDTLVYTCNITAPLSPRSINLWIISSIQEFSLKLDQDPFFKCYIQSYSYGLFTAMNIGLSPGPPPLCTYSSLTTIASMNYNSQKVSCYNFGGRYKDLVGSALIYVAGAPDVKVSSSMNQLLVTISTIPSQATSITYLMEVSQGNLLVLNRTITTNGTLTLPVDNLIPNTNYTITVSVADCQQINSTVVTKCTLASALDVTVDYDYSHNPVSLTWTPMANCVSGYQVLLMTNNGSLYQYNVSSSNCDLKCSIFLNLSYSFEYYILNISSITDGSYGFPNMIYLIGNDSDTLVSQRELQPMCPNTTLTYTCSSTDLVPGETVWIFSNGTCPDKNDSIRLTRNAANNCSSAYGTCANFTASNSEPIHGFCLTSTLTAITSYMYNGYSVQCLAIYENYTDFEGNGIISVVSPPDYNGAAVQPNLTELRVNVLTTLDKYSTFSIELVNVTKVENISAFFVNLSPNTRYVINTFASNCAGSVMETTTVCTLAMPPVITSGFSKDNRFLYIYWTDMGGCVTKYRVRITTDNGSVIIDNSNVASSFYILEINESTRQPDYRTYVSSITGTAAGSIVGPESNASIAVMENSCTCKVQLDVIIALAAGYVLPTLILFCCCCCGCCRKKGNTTATPAPTTSNSSQNHQINNEYHAYDEPK